MATHRGLVVLTAIASLLALVPVLVNCRSESEVEVQAFLGGVDQRLETLRRKAAIANWEYETNISRETLSRSLDRQKAVSEKLYKFAARAKDLSKRECTKSLSASQRRQLDLLRQINDGRPKSSDNARRLQLLISSMAATYSTATDRYGRELDPTLIHLMERSKNETELRDAWLGWRNAVGPHVREMYEQYVELMNVGARDTGFSDAGEVWRSGYDMSPNEYTALVASRWDELHDLYNELHCYVRRRLAKRYGREKTYDKHGRIYAHLLGNMWAQSWDTIYDSVAPFPEREPLRITDRLRERGYNASSMLRTAASFYESVGFEALPASFWRNSMILKPEHKQVVCHPSAWDVDLDERDVRLKMCTTVSQEDFLTMHHELGHVYYYLSYRKQPPIFRSGANDGFHEAIGDTIALSAFTDANLGRLKLLPDTYRNRSASDRHCDSINYLFAKALERVAFLPFGYLLDVYRWKLFSGEVSADRSNAEYWRLRGRVQGVAPPVRRSDARGDFDAGSKFHVVDSVPYMRYFMASLYQFQFHEALCRLAGHDGPLHECTIFDSTAAGSALQKMLARGSSQPWQRTIEELTGNDTLSAEPMLRYFAPLMEFLREENHGKQCGWKVDDGVGVKVEHELLDMELETHTTSCDPQLHVAARVLMAEQGSSSPNRASSPSLAMGATLSVVAICAVALAVSHSCKRRRRKHYSSLQ